MSTTPQDDITRDELDAQRQSSDPDRRGYNIDPDDDAAAHPSMQDRKAENIKAHHQREIRRLELEIEQHQAIVDAQDKILSDGVEAGHDLNRAFGNRGDTDLTASNHQVAPVHRGVDDRGHPLDPEGDAARTEDRAGISTNASDRDVNDGDGNSLEDRRGVDTSTDTTSTGDDALSFSSNPGDPDVDDGETEASADDLENPDDDDRL